MVCIRAWLSYIDAKYVMCLLAFLLVFFRIVLHDWSPEKGLPDGVSVVEPANWTWRTAEGTVGDQVRVDLYKYVPGSEYWTEGVRWSLTFPDYYFYWETQKRGGPQKFVLLEVYGENFDAVGEAVSNVYDNDDLDREEREEILGFLVREGILMNLYSSEKGNGFFPMSKMNHEIASVHEDCGLYVVLYEGGIKSESDEESSEILNFTSISDLPDDYSEFYLTNVHMDSLRSDQFEPRNLDHSFYAECTAGSHDNVKCIAMSYFFGWQFDWTFDFSDHCKWKENLTDVGAFLMSHTVEIDRFEPVD